MGKSARYKPLCTDVRPGSRLYSYGGRYPDRFCTLVRLTRSKMVVAIDDDDVDERCVNRELFTDAANAPIPDPASQSVPTPAPAALLRPASPLQAPIWPSVTLHGSAYPDLFLPHPPDLTDSILVRGSLVPVCELIKQEPVLHHRFLLCCTSFAAAGVDPVPASPASCTTSTWRLNYHPLSPLAPAHPLQPLGSLPPPPPPRANFPTFQPPTPPLPSPCSRARQNACQVAADPLRHVPSPVPDLLRNLPTQHDAE